MTFQDKYLQMAVDLARENLKKNNGGPFGAVVVKNGKVIATGVNTVTTDHDPTAHAEINAIRKACQVMKSHQLDDCEIYSSCEPCPMCLSAIYWARPVKLYYAASRLDAASAGFDDALIYSELEKQPILRRLPNEHIEIKGAKEVFREWKKERNKTMY